MLKRKESDDLEVNPQIKSSIQSTNFTRKDEDDEPADKKLYDCVQYLKGLINESLIVKTMVERIHNSIFKFF